MGTWNLVNGDGLKTDVTIASEDKNYFFCLQDMSRYKPTVFPFVPSKQPEGETIFSLFIYYSCQSDFGCDISASPSHLYCCATLHFCFGRNP